MKEVDEYRAWSDGEALAPSQRTSLGSNESKALEPNGQMAEPVINPNGRNNDAYPNRPRRYRRYASHVRSE